MATKRSVRKSKGSDLSTTARWAFLVGLALSVLAGLAFAFPPSGDPRWQEYVLYVIMVLGLVSSYLYISKDSEHHFILLAIGLAVFSDRLSYFPTLGAYLASIFGLVTVYLAMAVIAIVVRNMVSWFRS